MPSLITFGGQQIPGFGKIPKPPLEGVGSAPFLASNPRCPTDTTDLGIFHGCGEGMGATEEPPSTETLGNHC